VLKVVVTQDWQGKPLSALQDMIKKRQSIMGESAKDAVVATAENVLVSLRAETRLASPPKIRSVKVKVEDTGYYASYSYSERRRVVRTGTSPHASKVQLDGRVRWLDRGVSRAQRHVYRVTPIRPGEAQYYVAAATSSVAETFERTRAWRRADRSASLARNALSHAMAKVSTRPPRLEGKPSASKPMLTTVMHTDLGDQYSLLIVDNLDYSIAALKGGESAISLAMMKASNKIAGRLAKWQEKYFFRERVTTPFPEIVRPRKK
jgi:hypothetical protein